MQLSEWVTTGAAGMALLGAAVGGLALLRNRVVHGRDLTQASLDQRRLLRMSHRLEGCVVELERAVRVGLGTVTPGMIPERFVGHLVYLYGLRSELDLFEDRARAHNARHSWVDSLRQRSSATTRRCLAAQSAVAAAADALRIAARTYEDGFQAALRKIDGQPVALALADPLAILPGKRSRTLLAARGRFDAEMQLIAEHTGNRRERLQHFRCDWPVLTSELATFEDIDPYRGDVRPVSRVGFGDVPALHLDAR